jgi:hypothetical protein
VEVEHKAKGPAPKPKGGGSQGRKRFLCQLPLWLYIYMEPLPTGEPRPYSRFDSRCPPSRRCPSRHTGTGGAADGVHAQCLGDPGAGDRSPVVPRAAARRSQMVPPRSKQLGSQTRRCQGSRGDRGPASGRAQEGRRQPRTRSTDFGIRSCVLRVFFRGILLVRRGSRNSFQRDRDSRTGRLL